MTNLRPRRAGFVDQDDEIATLAPVMPNPAFLKWFGDSKVVDAAGAPLVVFHGTLKSFNNFSVGDVGFHFGTLNQAESRVRTLTQGLPDEGKNIMPVYLAIKNPLRTPDAGQWNDSNCVACMLGDMMVDDDAFAAAYERALNNSPPGQDFKGILEAMGYDGIVYANVGEETLDFGEEAGDDSWIAFRPEQIKSAIGNCGDFDDANPDCRFSLVDDDEASTAEAPCQ